MYLLLYIAIDSLIDSLIYEVMMMMKNAQNSTIREPWNGDLVCSRQSNLDLWGAQ